MAPDIECPHATARKSKYIVEGRIVIACNNCNPRELVDGAITTPVVPAYEFEETDPVPEHPGFDVAFDPVLDRPETKVFEDDGTVWIPIADDIRFEAMKVAMKPAVKPELDRPGFESLYPTFLTDVEKAQGNLDFCTERLRAAMLKANGVEGLTWAEIARITGKKSGQAAYQYATFKSTKKES